MADAPIHPRFSPKGFALSSTACHHLLTKMPAHARSLMPSLDDKAVDQSVPNIDFYMRRWLHRVPIARAFYATRGTELLSSARPARFSETWTHSSVKSMP